MNYVDSILVGVFATATPVTEEALMGWVRLGASLTTAIAFLSVAAGLLYFMHRRQEATYRRLIWLFCCFFLLNGAAQVIDSVAHGSSPWLYTSTNLLIAAVSLSVVVSLIPLMPQISTMRTRAELEHEIDERKRAEAAFVESEARFSSAFEFAPIGKAMMSLDGVHLVVNPALCRFLGYSRMELTGLHYKDVIEFDDQPDEFAEMIRRLVNNEIDYYRCENRFRRKDGRRVWGLRNISLIRQGDGSPIRIIVQIVDINSLKDRERDLKKAHSELEIRVALRTADLEAVNHELSQYSYAVAHDLRAPLRGIRRYAEFLREDLQKTLEGEQKSHLDGLTRAVKEAETFVKDLLDLSKIGEDPLPKTEAKLSEMVADLVRSLNLPATCSVTVQENLPNVVTEPTLLRQSLQNLILNGLKFNKSSHKNIQISAKQIDKEVEIRVRDNGIGIAARHHRDIFNVFRRLHKSDDYPGTGIGLAVVKKAISKIGGKIKVESEEGMGSTFIITLPKRPPSDLWGKDTDTILLAEAETVPMPFPPARPSSEPTDEPDGNQYNKKPFAEESGL